MIISISRRKILSVLSIAALGHTKQGHRAAAFVLPRHAHSSTTTRLRLSSTSYLENLSSPTAATTTTAAASFTTSAPSPPSAPFPSSSSSSSLSTFEYVPKLSLEQADAIANRAIACCQRNHFNPVTVYVLDAAGSPLVSKRMDGCPAVGIPDFAKAKAYSCVVNRYPSRAFRDRYTTPPHDDGPAKFCQMTTMVAISGGQMAPFPGGIVLYYQNHIVGAVGVSGAAGDEDEYCAIRGVIEANLGPDVTTVPAEHSCSTVKDSF